ncbi:MAG: type II toxin-antitoxin system HicA family toxin [Acidimicrobiales bacterium]
MTSKALLRLLTSRRFGCEVIRQRGSHVIVQCGQCRTVVPMHDRDLAPGTWADIRSALAPCLGERWWT